MEVTTVLLAIIIAVVSIALYYIRDRLSYWKKRGIPHDEPTFIYGNIKGVASDRHLKDVLQEMYKKYKGSGPFCGVYFLTKPAVLALDKQLIKNILVKDFTSFIDRGVFYNEKEDPLSAHLFSLDSDKWTLLRRKLSPTFSSGKMKFMFPTVVDVGHRFAKTFAELIGENGTVVEIKEINARFTTDVIGTCAFGIECNSLKDPNAKFRLYGRKMFTEGRHHPLIFNFLQSFPKLARKLGFKVIPEDINSFFMNAVKETVAYREKNQLKRNDFMDIMIDLKNGKQIKSDDGQLLTGLTIEEVAAQAFVFYLAGFETSSSTMSFAMYELALHTDVQDKMRTEIDQVLAKYNGELTYESIQDMHYIDQVVDETLRMYAIVPTLQRVANVDYDTGYPKYKIDKGTVVLIPAFSIHYDPENYPNPSKFDPERFTPEEKQKREACTWLPFGEGPRNCIGLRFGKMQTKIGLALMVKNFKFSACSKTQIPIQFDVSQPQRLIASLGGIYLKAEKI